MTISGDVNAAIAARVSDDGKIYEELHTTRLTDKKLYMPVGLPTVRNQLSDLTLNDSTWNSTESKTIDEKACLPGMETFIKRKFYLVISLFIFINLHECSINLFW